MNLELGKFVIMPNHFHGIVIIQNGTMNDDSGNRPIAPARPIIPTCKMRTTSLSSLMAGFQSPVTSKINQLRGTPKRHVWQSNFFDRIIRKNKK